MRFHLILLFTIILLSSCKKEELVNITGNEPPPDRTTESVVISNYINRTYILVLGREPDVTENNSAYNLLFSGNIDSLSRQRFINTVYAATDYRAHVYDQNRIDLLNNIDTTEFRNYNTIINRFLQDTTYRFQWPALQLELDRLDALRATNDLFISGSISLRELQKSLCNNYFYDQINMGSANFVLSTFSHLIRRNPTLAEQESAVSMIDGNNSILFLESGSSKTDYLTIFFSSDDYFEGQVVSMYDKFLHRSPSSVEMTNGTALYKSSNDYTLVEKGILRFDEFIGL